jgi:hypothetical protein
MLKSESIKELALALSKAQGQFDHAKKDVKNEFFKSKYADLASVIDAAKKPLSDNGLSVSQICETTESGDIRLETILMHSSGEYISGNYPIRPIKSDPQSYGSAITYARRYAFSAITGIAADDDDGNQASQSVPYKAPAKSIDTNSIDYSILLNSANSLDELVKLWESIPKNKQAYFVDLKNQLKEKLLMMNSFSNEKK